MAFGPDVDTSSTAIPYLHAEPRAAQRWSKRLAGLHNSSLPRIGLACAGRTLIPEVDAGRNMPVEIRRAHLVAACSLDQLAETSERREETATPATCSYRRLDQ
jgi:hypothetical protein